MCNSPVGIRTHGGPAQLRVCNYRVLPIVLLYNSICLLKNAPQVPDLRCYADNCEAFVLDLAVLIV